MKHFGAAIASFGSVALFHIVGITPEAQRLGRRRRHGQTLRTLPGRRGRYPGAAGELSARASTRSIVVVFSAPQLSLVEMRQLADPARRPPRHHPAARDDEPAGQAGRRPHGAHRAHRGGRRPRAVRHVLLPELRPRDGGGERLEAARDQFGEAHQHSRRLWLPAGADVDGSMRRCRLRRRKARVNERSVLRRLPEWGRRCAAGARRQGRLFGALRSRSHPRRVLPARSTSSPARAMSAAC